MTKKFTLVLILAITVAFFVGCQDEKPQDAPDIVGEVLDITNDKVVRVLVDSLSENITGQIWVSITEETAFVDSQGETIVTDDIESLFEIGKTASFLSNGMIMESYPMQTSGDYVFISD